MSHEALARVALIVAANLAKRLQDGKTASATQKMQKEIEDMLTMLIDALRQQIEAGPGGAP